MVLPYKEQEGSKKEQVAKMFNNISAKYDFLNHFLSLGIDKRWRRKTIKMVASRKPKTVLDVATGTADFAIDAMKLKPYSIIGVDISDGMLQVGREKLKQKSLNNTIDLRNADSENLPFENDQFDLITVGFGVRNFEHLEVGLKEMKRVMSKDGILAILEFSKPHAFPVKQIYGFYFKYILPGLGKFFSKDSSAYTYLPESVEVFPEGEEFCSILKKLEFKNVKMNRLMFGIASIYLAEK